VVQITSLNQQLVLKSTALPGRPAQKRSQPEQKKHFLEAA